MNYIFITRVLIILLIFVIITRIIMMVANYIGREFGIGKLIIELWYKVAGFIKKIF